MFHISSVFICTSIDYLTIDSLHFQSVTIYRSSLSLVNQTDFIPQILYIIRGRSNFIVPSLLATIKKTVVMVDNNAPTPNTIAIILWVRVWYLLSLSIFLYSFLYNTINNRYSMSNIVIVRKSSITKEK